MKLVVTTGAGSMDRYSQELSAHLDVPVIRTAVYQEIAERFNIPLFSRGALDAAIGDWRFIRLLRSLNEPLHLPNHHLGRYARFLNQPYVITVHDLIRYFDTQRRRPYIHRPNLRDRMYLALDQAGIRRAAAIIAVSRVTRFDIMSYLDIPGEHIHVVYEGVNHDRFHPVRERPFDFPYVLYVGSEHPRKNFSALLTAFREVKATAAIPGLKLVKVGAAGGAEASFRDDTLRTIRELDLEQDVILAGRVEDEELPGYYSGAVCCVLPSLYEGFGLPTLEAMACGCPVIVSSAGALPEVAGDAAVIVSPHAPELLGRALFRMLLDHTHRQEMVQRGLSRAQEFSWERTARETQEVYRMVEERAQRSVVLPATGPIALPLPGDGATDAGVVPLRSARKEPDASRGTSMSEPR